MFEGGRRSFHAPSALVFVYVMVPLICLTVIEESLIRLPLFIAILEAGFLIWTKVMLRKYQEPNPAIPWHDVEETIEGVRGFAKLCGWSADDYKAWVCGWFLLPVEDFGRIRKGNIHEWLASGFFSKEISQLDDDELGILTDKTALFESWCEAEFEEGYTADIRPMRHTLDPVRASWYPLFVYVALRGLRTVIISIFYMYGFRVKNARAYQCVVKKGKPGKVPVVIVHGLGLGVVPYLQMAVEVLKQASDRSVVLVELPEIAMLLNDRVLAIPEAVECYKYLVSSPQGPLGECAIGHATFVAHSYGSCHLSWLLKHAPETVAHSVFIDPIVFLLFLPQAAHNAIYRECLSFVETFIRREMHTAYTLSRHFWWYRNNLFAELLPPERNLVVLGGKDIVVPAKSVNQYLQKHQGVRVMYHNDLGHADVVLQAEHRSTLVRSILELNSTDV